MASLSVYVASPLGFTDAGRHYLSDVLHPALVAAGLSVHDPWADPTSIVASTVAIPPDDPRSHPALGAMNQTLGSLNAAAIAAADGVLAILDGSDVDSGTAAEIGYATGLGIPVVGLRTDIRTSGDNAASVVNLQVEYFIAVSGGRIERTVEAAITSITAVAAERYLFHLARADVWAAAVANGTYTASTRDASLEEVGFIHLSFARQLADTARRHYSDIAAEELLLLTVDRRLLSSRLLVEIAPSIGDAFPHVYGPLNLDAVIGAERVERDESGNLVPHRP
jgi:uncharacterized protein (DUF952 family)/nucleoside 2-deoxyribosyltransferase